MHFLVLCALENIKTRTLKQFAGPRQSGSRRGGGEAGVHILVFWASERRGGGGSTHFSILGP